MPGQDKTGPLGQGALTGRGLGACGRGLRRGIGRGRLQLAEPVKLSKDQEKKILEAELAEIEAEKTEIEKQLKTLRS